MEITISNQFKDLIFPLSKEELFLLENSILKYGVKDPLVVWKNGKNYLLDGHHRFSIIKKHNIKNYKIISLEFENKIDALNWIIDNQIEERVCSFNCVNGFLYFGILTFLP